MLFAGSGLFGLSVCVQSDRARRETKKGQRGGTHHPWPFYLTSSPIQKVDKEKPAAGGSAAPAATTGKPPPREWSTQQVHDWIVQNIGNPALADRMRDEKIDGPALDGLSSPVLTFMGASKEDVEKFNKAKKEIFH